MRGLAPNLEALLGNMERTSFKERESSHRLVSK